MCCLSHQVMGLKPRRQEEPSVTTHKSTALTYHTTYSQPRQLAEPLRSCLLTWALSSVCPTEGKGFPAAGEVFLSPAGFRRAQRVPCVLRASEAARNHQHGSSITRPPDICALMSARLLIQLAAHRWGGNYCLNSGIS